MSRVFAMSFANLYPLYLTKVEKKGRTRAELDTVLCWLMSLDADGLQHHIDQKTNLADLFAAVTLHPHATAITGTVCGVRVEAVEDPLMQKIRYMDKLVDELAKGRKMEKILRAAPAQPA